MAGRKKIEIRNNNKFRKTVELYKADLISITDAASILGLSRTTFYRRMKEADKVDEMLK